MLDPVAWHALRVSLQVAGVALVLMVLPGVPLAWLLARKQFPGRSLLDALCHLPLVLPPVVTGYALLWLLSPQGWVGAAAEGWFGAHLLFRWPAASLAAAVVSFPLFLRSLRIAIEGVDIGLEEAAASLGASPWRVAWRITLPLARHGLLAGLLLGFSRALGEFGATILVAGNIPGETQTIPLAIFSLSQRGQMGAVLPLVVVVSIVGFAAVLLANRLQRGGGTR